MKDSPVCLGSWWWALMEISRFVCAYGRPADVVGGRRRRRDGRIRAQRKSMVCSTDVLAIFVGTMTTVLLSATMVVAALKAGITPGVSPLVVLFCWGALGKLAQGENGTRFLALAQVSGSAAMPVVSGCVFAGPLLQVLYLQKAQAALSEAGVDCNLETM